jgi:hypothetical protein
VLQEKTVETSYQLMYLRSPSAEGDARYTAVVAAGNDALREEDYVKRTGGATLTMLEEGPKKMKRKSKEISAEGRRSASMLAAAFGAAAIGAFAIGALAIGRLAIGRIVAGRVTFKSLRVEELNVTRLRVSELVVSESLELPAGGKQENRESR